MFFFRNGRAAVLLLVLTQSLVRASFEDEKNTKEALAKVVINSMQVPWTNRIDSAILSSETSCAEEFTAMSQAIMAQETWAMHMLDASSKIQSGILKGNYQGLGMYDQCVEAKGQYNGTYVQGKYCTVSLSIFSSAVCFPSSCNETDVVTILEAVMQNVTGTNESVLAINGATCVSVESEDFTTGEILAIFFFSAVGAFMFFCTICEFANLYRPANEPSVITELAKFSLYTNAMALLSTKSNPRMMPAIQGIRFLSMCWVVLGHRYTIGLTMPMVNPLDVLEWGISWTALYVLVTPFAVDTFFVISGFLMCYLFLKSKQSGRKSNFPMMYLHRYLRLTPCQAVVILFVVFFLRRIGSGPIWDSTIDPSACRTNWWVNLLYVQNFVRANQMCLTQSWYLAVDMQLFWISPFILYPLYRWPKWGLGLLSLLLVASVVTPAVFVAVKGYSNAVARLDMSVDEILNNQNKFYIPTYNRACAYFVGILLGYDVANRKRHFSRVAVAINWIVAAIFMVACGLATKRIYNFEVAYDKVLETVFAIFLRPFWSIAIAWIVYACSFGYGGPVTRFLSLPIFLPLSRLSYCMYLVHMTIIQVKGAATKHSGRFTDFLFLNEYCADLVLSIAVAFVLSLFFESPVIVLEKMLTNSGRKRSLVREPKKDVEVGIDNKGMTITET